MTGIVLGRFQPLHRGHETLVSYAVDRYDDVSIVLGAYSGRTEHDPLTTEERRRLFEARFPEVDVHAVRDTGCREESMAAIESCASGDLTAVTSNPWTTSLFRQYGYAVDWFEKEYEHHASDVRRRAREGEPWRHLVSSPVEDVLDDVDFERLLRELAAEESTH